jgi:hypothetical protein
MGMGMIPGWDEWRVGEWGGDCGSSFVLLGAGGDGGTLSFGWEFVIAWMRNHTPSSAASTPTRKSSELFHVNGGNCIYSLMHQSPACENLLWPDHPYRG